MGAPLFFSTTRQPAAANELLRGILRVRVLPKLAPTILFHFHFVVPSRFPDVGKGLCAVVIRHATILTAAGTRIDTLAGAGAVRPDLKFMAVYSKSVYSFSLATLPLVRSSGTKPTRNRGWVTRPGVRIGSPKGRVERSD